MVPGGTGRHYCCADHQCRRAAAEFGINDHVRAFGIGVEGAIPLWSSDRRSATAGGESGFLASCSYAHEMDDIVRQPL
jgi:hypothetical protein